MQEKVNDCTTNEDVEKLVQEFQEIIKKKTKKTRVTFVGQFLSNVCESISSNVCGSIFE